MSLLSIPRTVVGRSLRLTRAPIDFVLTSAGIKAPPNPVADAQRERARQLREKADAERRRADRKRQAAERRAEQAAAEKKRAAAAQAKARKKKEGGVR